MRDSNKSDTVQTLESDSLALLKIYCRHACLFAICAANATSDKHSMSPFEQTSHWVRFLLHRVSRRNMLLKTHMCNIIFFSLTFTHAMRFDETLTRVSLIPSVEWPSPSSVSARYQHKGSRCAHSSHEVCDWDVVRNTENDKRGQIVLEIQHPVRMLT